VDQALLEKPGSAEAIAFQSVIALGEGKLDRAVDLARKSLAIDPNAADAQLVLGTVDQSNGKNDSAKAHYEKYLLLAPHGEHADDIRGVLRNLH
jgi:Tfp pilus assembly protein PilF